MINRELAFAGPPDTGGLDPREKARVARLRKDLEWTKMGAPERLRA